MLAYEVDGRVVTIRADGELKVTDRLQVFEAIRQDSAVQNGSLLLLDGRGVTMLFTEAMVAQQLSVMLDMLGTKVGIACALVVNPRQELEATTFQSRAAGHGLTVAIFQDEPKARAWLRAYE
jgi:hypothetical protein